MKQPKINTCSYCLSEIDPEKFYEARQCEKCGNCSYYSAPDILTQIVMGIGAGYSFRFKRDIMIGGCSRTETLSQEEILECAKIKRDGVLRHLEREKTKSYANGILTGFLVALASITISLAFVFSSWIGE